MKLSISIISLEKDETRRTRLLSELSPFNVNINIISAVNGKELSAEEYFNQYKCESSKFGGRTFLTPSELGCILSHKKALKEFLVSSNDWLLVLEDDVSIVNDISHIEYELGRLDNNGIYILGGQDGLKSFSRVLFKKSNLHDYSRVIFKTYRWIYRTCCYLISRDSAVEIYNLMLLNRFMADDWKYIIKNTAITDIYYSQFFSHPIDLNDSSIEKERLLIK